MNSNKGFSKILVILGSMVMLLGLLAVSFLVTNNQDNRNKASYGCSETTRPNISCVISGKTYGWTCNTSKGIWECKTTVPVPTLIPTPITKCGRTSRENGCECSRGEQCKSTHCGSNDQCDPKPTADPNASCVGGKTKCVDGVAQMCYCNRNNNFCFYKSLGVGCNVTIVPSRIPSKIPTSIARCALFGRERGCDCINKSQCKSAICENHQCK